MVNQQCIYFLFVHPPHGGINFDDLLLTQTHPHYVYAVVAAADVLPLPVESCPPLSRDKLFGSEGKNNHFIFDMPFSPAHRDRPFRWHTPNCVILYKKFINV